MINFKWICWCLLEGVPTLFAFPIDSSKPPDGGNFWTSQWENWPQYTVGILSLVVIAFTLAGCLCCQRQRRPKGFQDDAGTGKEFKDGSTAGTETTIERVPSSSLELEVPRILTSSREKIQFDEIPCNYGDGRSAIKPPSSSLYNDEDDEEKSSRDRPRNEWYEGENFPREKLKYLREIGRGWFGKVVEGTTIIEQGNTTNLGKNRGVVVRILTEGATSREKSWFLGESTPYLKLRHPNILELLGFCLETDPFLLLFESCPVGDLKNFLLENRKSGDTLRKENVPMRMALNIANALEHMHENGFAHTDLSARNCLVCQDLTAKLGDYGVGVEKYPSDYYVVGDRALPIRWSAPESLQCTETTIETRAITPSANIWSYGVLLWEIASWAERPYDDLGDEQVIEMIFSIRNDKSVKLLNKLIDKNDLPENFREVLKSTWKFAPAERSSLRQVKDILCGKKIEDFERRWENLKPNGPASVDKSASLQDLRGSMDSELWQANSYLDKNSLRANFRLGPEEPVVNCVSLRETFSQAESGSETEEESWRGRVERGAYTEKVKQKSKSVADLMVLVHIDSDSDVESSLGPQNIEKPAKKRLPPSGSDGDLRSAVIADEFDEALRKLRDPCIANGVVVVKTVKSPTTDNVKTGESVKIPENTDENVETNENMKKPKLLTLTNQGKTPILRLSFGNPAKASNSAADDDTRDEKDEKCAENIQEETNLDNGSRNATELSRNEELVLRLVSKGNPDLPLLRYIPERSSTPVNSADNKSSDSFVVAGNLQVPPSVCKPEENAIDVELWNDVLGHELEKKNPVSIENSSIFDESVDEKMDYFDNSLIVPLAKDDYHAKISKSGSSTPKSLQNFDVATENHYVSGCLSAPTTPRYDSSSLTTRRAEGGEKVTKNTDYYPEDEGALRGTLSAPETPFRKSYNVTINDEELSTCEDLDERMTVKDSAPDTPQSRGNYSVGNGDEDLSSVGEELEPGMIKRSSHEGDDEEDRKHLSTPDDERSSDSGFRDKESCEEEESPIPGSQVSSIILGAKISCPNPENSSPLSASAEEEQMRILFELDTILDAEYYGDYRDSDKIDDTDTSLENIKLHFEDTDEIADKIRSISESHGSTESTDILETVRANSCDANFLDHFFSAKDDTNQESKFEYLNDTSSADLLESIEADSVSEFSKLEENRSNSKKEDLLADFSCESPIKTDKYPSTDSSVELVRLNIDSSESRAKSDLTTDFSLDTASDLIKNESSSEISPMQTDRNSITDVSPDVRVESSDSRSSSGRAQHKNVLSDEIYEARRESESFSHSSNKTDENNIPGNCTMENDAEIETTSCTLGEEGRKNSYTKNTDTSDPEMINLSTSLISPVEKENSSSENVTKISTQTKSPTCLISGTDQGELETSSKTENHSSPIDETHSANISRDNVFLSPEMEDATSSPGGIERLNSRQDEVSEYIEEIKSLDGLVETHDKIVSSSNESLLTIDDNRGSNLSVDTQRDPLNSDIEQWSSRENINEEAEEDSSTMSLKSDNSYVSFGLDEAFVTAIRNELTEKLPRAQMPVVEALDPHDEAETASINPETTSKGWGEDDDIEENPERSSVDISIRYNIYGTPLSPILEERESAATSESLFSKEESADASIASRVSALSEDVLVVDTRTNRAIIVEAGANGGNTETFNSQLDDDRDTSHGDISDEENLEYPHNNFNRGLGTKRITMGSGGAPLPSPEEESKWQQQFPLPLQMQDDLMSTSFGTDRDWDSQDDEEGEDEVEEGEDDEEENSSSSGEFVWKRYDESPGDLEKVATRSPPSKPKCHETEAELDEEEDEGDDGDEEDEEEEEEFTPSAWDATLAPHRSALRSPEKNLKSSDQKKSVWFKKQRYHCVYEYPKETPVLDAQGQVATTWEPTSYADWEDMMDEPRLDMYPMEYDETNRAGDEEFYVSSSSRPFQFQSGDGKYVSQFFPGASTTLLQQESQQQMASSPRDASDSRSSQDEVDRADPVEIAIVQANGNSRSAELNESQQQAQLGELRHTRDRLKLNLLSTTGSTRTEGEAVPEIRSGECSSIVQIGGLSERTDVAPKTDEHSENSESPKNLEKLNMGPKEILPSPEKPRDEKEFPAKLEDRVELRVDAQNVAEIAEKNENESARCDDGTEKRKDLMAQERQPIENERGIAKETIETQEEKMREQVSNLEIVSNLAVIETSKIENNERDKKEEALCTDDKKSSNENVDEKIDAAEESKTFGNVEKVTDVRSTEGEFLNFGDQKGECSSSRPINDPRKYENVEIAALEKSVNPPNSEDEARSKILDIVSINNSSKKGKNIDEIKETGTVQSSSQS